MVVSYGMDKLKMGYIWTYKLNWTLKIKVDQSTKQ